MNTCLLSRSRRNSFAVFNVIEVFNVIMSLYYGEAGMQVERCGEDCYDLGNL